MESLMAGHRATRGDSEEAHCADDPFFDNTSILSMTWNNVEVHVKDRVTGQDRTILSSCHGHVAAGEVVALMGPSGSGKTTLLNVLASRSQAAYTGSIKLNDEPIHNSDIRHVSSFVEQEDALIGSLSVYETVDFTAKLGSPGSNKRDRRVRVENLLSSLGLLEQKNQLVGTPLRKGISGGQKRRLSVATQLLAAPRILFLDEPTSGLDSVASFEVMNFVSRIAKKHRLLVIASIHQPSTSTFDLFDSVMLLTQGKTCYFGPTAQVTSYFNNLYPIPLHTNPAEFLLELVNTDFTRHEKDEGRVDTIVQAWRGAAGQPVRRKPLPRMMQTQFPALAESGHLRPSANFSAPFILLHRNFIKSYRDFLAYGTRVVMYTGLAIMMGTVWLRLDYVQASIQPFINAIFFGGAFMSFMAVAYVPSIIEDVHMLRKESAIGLYGPLAFSISNFLIGIPWLFAITMVFSIITYWLSNFHNTAQSFWLWVLYLFLDLLAAESLVVLVSTISFNFVIALAVTAFANGLWMAVGGFLVPLGTLNVFWKYVFHYIDYQAYVFQGMMVNQFRDTVYSCDRIGRSFHCMYAGPLQQQGKIQGAAVLKAYHISNNNGIHGRWVGIMIAIIAVYRLLGYLALVWRARKY